ncbi:MAG: sigma-70 family RNA polymerase sigma factor [Gemmatimonadales bacterium]|nr:sigma-70 family RNA polymerase sigma factor [Gemmatimonadales bacterium]
MTDAEAVADSELAAAWRRGDEAAATQLVRRHAEALSRFLYASGADGSDLDDLVQEAFFRAFRRIDGWRGDASFRSWLFTIAGNLLKDSLRRRKGKTLLPIEDRDFATTDDPGGEVEANEAEARMRAAIATLPRLQREVFLLRVQEGGSYEEIAAALGTTPGAARVHYHHAVKRLKESVA